MVTKQKAKEIYDTFVNGLKKVLRSEDTEVCLVGEYFWIKFDNDANYFYLNPDSLDLDYFCYEGKFEDFYDSLTDVHNYIRKNKRNYESLIWCFKHTDKLVEEGEEE